MGKCKQANEFQSHHYGHPIINYSWAGSAQFAVQGSPTLNSSKCNTMLITRKKQCWISNQFFLHLKSLDRVYLFKYLVSQLPIISAGLNIFRTLLQEQKEWLVLFIGNSTTCATQALSENCIWLLFDWSWSTVAMHVWDPFLHKYIELLESVQKFSIRVCTKHWRGPHNHLCNFLKLPLLKDRRKKLKLTMVYKCLNGLMVMSSNIFFPSELFKTEAHFCISHLHTQIVIYIPVSHVLCLYGTNCLRTFTTASPFLL